MKHLLLLPVILLLSSCIREEIKPDHPLKATLDGATYKVSGDIYFTHYKSDLDPDSVVQVFPHSNILSYSFQGNEVVCMYFDSTTSVHPYVLDDYLGEDVILMPDGFGYKRTEFVINLEGQYMSLSAIVNRGYRFYSMGAMQIADKSKIRMRLVRE